MSPGLADFAGLWQINRKIDDKTGLGAGTLIGEARFLRDGAGYRYAETGTLCFARQPPMEARQSYLWREDGQGIAVLFPDGRPFHSFVPDDQPIAAHWCDPDQYDVAYAFSAWPDWQSTWRVKGPRKDYEMITFYRR